MPLVNACPFSTCIVGSHLQIRFVKSFGGVVVVAVVGLLGFCEAPIGRWLCTDNFSQKGVKLYVNSMVGCSGGWPAMLVIAQRHNSF